MVHSLKISVLVVVVAAAFSLPALAGEPYLVKDIAPGAVGRGSSPRILQQAGNRVVFVANDGGGAEPWGSDGTAAGTEPLIDGCPELCLSSRSFGRTDRLGFFRMSSDGVHFDLWSTDGTRGGTFQLTRQPAEALNAGGIFLGPASTPTQIYFAGSDPAHGIELWRSDGTARGTALVADLVPGRAGSKIADLRALGERVVFVAEDSRGPALWGSDGTRQGTRLLLDPNPRSASHDRPRHLWQAGSYVYFTATVGALGNELWRTDGTPAGTVRVADLAPRAASLDFVAGGTMGDRLLFVAATPGQGREVWISNGTASGTYPLSAYTGADPFVASAFPATDFFLHVDLGTRALFVADDGVHGREVWTTEGKRGDARLLRDLCPGPCPGFGFFFGSQARAGGQVIFRGDDGTHGEELWATDGTTGGTQMIGDLCPGACDAGGAYVQGLGSRFGFVLLSTQGIDLWSWSPAGGPPSKVASFDPDAFGPTSWRAIGRRLFLAAPTREFGSEMWTSNLTPQGTLLVRDIEPFQSPFSSTPSDGMKAGDRTLFFAYDGNFRLWRTDGTAAGTQRVAPSTEGPFHGTGKSSDLNGTAIFLAIGREGSQLWRSDGTAGGTFILTSDAAGVEAAQDEDPVAAGGLAYFSAYLQAEGTPEPWVTDGTTAGTRRLADLVPGQEGSYPADFTALGAEMAFIARSPSGGQSLWFSDGTPAGTRIVRSATGDDHFGVAPNFVAWGDRLYFKGMLPDSRLVWSTDGTDARTVVAIDGASLGEDLRDLTPVAASDSQLFLMAYWAGRGHVLHALTRGVGSPVELARLDDRDTSPRQWTIAGGRLYFLTELGRLWVSDGTPGGTGRMRDAQGATIDDASNLRILGGRPCFARTREGVSGIWAIDGSPAQARRLASLPSSPANREPLLGEAGGKILYVGDTPETGAELWAVEP